MDEETDGKLKFETSKEVEVLNTFDAMGLREDLLRGLYAYGANAARKAVTVCCKSRPSATCSHPKARKQQVRTGRVAASCCLSATAPRARAPPGPRPLVQTRGWSLDNSPRSLLNCAPLPRPRETLGDPAACDRADDQGPRRHRPGPVRCRLGLAIPARLPLRSHAMPSLRVHSCPPPLAFARLRRTCNEGPHVRRTCNALESTPPRHGADLVRGGRRHG